MICLDHYYSLFLSPFLKIGTMIESFHLPGNFSLFQIELISLWSQSELFYPYFNQFCWDLINTWWFVLFGFSVSISTSKALSSGTSGSTLPNIINPMHIQKLQETITSSARILWESVTKSPFSSFTILVLWC